MEHNKPSGSNRYCNPSAVRCLAGTCKSLERPARPPSDPRTGGMMHPCPLRQAATQRLISDRWSGMGRSRRRLHDGHCGITGVSAPMLLHRHARHFLPRALSLVSTYRAFQCVRRILPNALPRLRPPQLVKQVLRRSESRPSPSGGGWRDLASRQGLFQALSSRACLRSHASLSKPIRAAAGRGGR